MFFFNAYFSCLSMHIFSPNFLERKFRENSKVSESFYFSTKFPHQEIGWNFGYFTQWINKECFLSFSLMAFFIILFSRNKEIQLILNFLYKTALLKRCFFSFSLHELVTFHEFSLTLPHLKFSDFSWFPWFLWLSRDPVQNRLSSNLSVDKI